LSVYNRGARPAAISRGPSDEDSGDWPEVVPFSRPLELPVFPTECLPEPLREFVRQEAAARQVPEDLPACIALGAVSAAASNKVRVAITPSLSEPLNLYVAVAAASGERKSPVFHDGMEPLERAERRMRLEAAPRLASLKARRDLEATRLKELTRLSAKGRNQAEREDAEQAALDLAAHLTPEEFEPRLIANDATPERVASLLGQNGGRLAISDGEGGGIFDTMDGRYSSNGAPNFDIYLKGYSGDSHHVDRVNRSAEHVESPAITLVLAVQPEVIAGLGARTGMRGRGLLARPLYSFPRSLVGTRQFVDRGIDEHCLAAYGATIDRLLAIEASTGTHHALRMSPDAKQLWIDVANQIESEQMAGGRLASISDWANKLAGRIARIAGCLHLAETETAEPWVSALSAHTLKSAISIGYGYFVPHALAAFSLMATDEQTARAQKILHWILRHDLKSFSLSDCRKVIFRDLKRSTDLLPATAILCDRGYIREISDSPAGKAGRPGSQQYGINPSLERCVRSAETPPSGDERRQYRPDSSLETGVKSAEIPALIGDDSPGATDGLEEEDSF
jgi:replicative DNA helicase